MNLLSTTIPPSEVFELCTHAARRGTRTFVRQNSSVCLLLLFGFILLSMYTTVDVLTLLWFFVLGISSSIGFGVGVPTRILFLIPYALRHATAEYFVDNYSVIFPVFFTHAIGSAIGELPPFLSSAVLTKYFNLEKGQSKVARFHQWVSQKMESRRFACIVALAAWPNATFDAAGLSAGASGMGTGSFLLATILGKACIRAPLACALVLAHLHSPWALPSFVTSMFEEKKETGYMGMLWTGCVTTITLYTLTITMIETAKMEKEMQK